MVQAGTRLVALSLATLAVVGCTGGPPTKPVTGHGVQATAALAGTGLVLGLDGKPAAGVKVTATLLGPDGGGVISNDGGSVISNDGSSLAGHAAAARSLLAAPAGLQATTDASGHFTLVLPAGAKANVEAVLSDDVKAIVLATSAVGGLSMKLDHVGTIAGRVTAPKGSTVTNLLGVDVYVPGTSYSAKTDASGAYTISNVPVGSFTLVASKTGLGSATVAGVVVTPRGTASAPDLQPRVQGPTVTAIDPPAAPAGATVTIHGTGFGASTGDILAVTIAGAVVSNPERKDDGTIAFVVPASARSGDLLVTVGGAASDARPFTVATKLAIDTAVHDLWVGETLKAVARVVDVDGHGIALPVTWQGSGAGSVGADGLVTATGEGKLTATASAGSLQADLALEVHAGPFVRTLAGGAPHGTAISDGTGAAASFRAPAGVALAADGTLYVADAGANAIRKVSPAGQVSTLAGDPAADAIADGPRDGQGKEARFNHPTGLALDARGALIVADTGNNRIRKVTPDGTVTTLAGTGAAAPPPGMPAVGAGILPGAGASYLDGPAAGAQFAGPAAVALDAAGNIYIADQANNVIRKLDAAGASVSTLAGGKGSPRPAAGYVDGQGTAAAFNGPSALAFDQAGNLIVADSLNQCLRAIDPTGRVTTLAGAPGVTRLTDGQGTAASLAGPVALAVDALGNLVIGDGTGGLVRQMTPDGGITTLLGNLAQPGPGPATDGAFGTATLGAVGGLAVDARGTIFVADASNGRIRQLVRRGP